jgi:hypothetical protein
VSDDMDCPHCGVPTVDFAVPESLRSHAPGESDVAAICPVCLRVMPIKSGSCAPDFDGFDDSVPDGETGVAMALALGLLDSLALNRRSIEALVEHVERGGADPLLVLDRLAASDGVRPHFDLDRRREQLLQLLD